jgi:hypothetical protein
VCVCIGRLAKLMLLDGYPEIEGVTGVKRESMLLMLMLLPSSWKLWVLWLTWFMFGLLCKEWAMEFSAEDVTVLPEAFVVVGDIVEAFPVDPGRPVNIWDVDTAVAWVGAPCVVAVVAVVVVVVVVVAVGAAGLRSNWTGDLAFSILDLLAAEYAGDEIFWPVLGFTVKDRAELSVMGCTGIVGCWVLKDGFLDREVFDDGCGGTIVWGTVPAFDACLEIDTGAAFEGCLELGTPERAWSINGTLVEEGLADIDPLCFWLGTWNDIRLAEGFSCPATGVWESPGSVFWRFCELKESLKLVIPWDVKGVFIAVALALALALGVARMDAGTATDFGCGARMLVGVYTSCAFIGVCGTEYWCCCGRLCRRFWCCCCCCCWGWILWYSAYAWLDFTVFMNDSVTLTTFLSLCELFELSLVLFSLVFLIICSLDPLLLA